MTNTVDLDRIAGKTASLPFESIDYEKAGIRLLPAQLARVCGVSKQAVSTWIKKGRIILGSDGRVDPRQAFDRLAATGDTAKLRMKILEPFRKDVAERDRRIDDLEVAVAARDRRLSELEAELASASDDSDFHETAAAEFLELFQRLQSALPDAWEALRTAPPAAGCAALIAWLDSGLTYGAAAVGEIADHLATPCAEWKGAGDDA